METAFQHLKGSGNREPQLVRVQQDQGGGGSGLLLWEKQEKEGKVVRCANRVTMYKAPRAIPFSAQAAVSHFGNHFQSTVGIVGSLECARLGERL